MRKDIVACVLAAGKGTRMKSAIPKVLHEVHSRPMISPLLEALKELGINKIVVVVSRDKKLIEETVKGEYKNVDFVMQAEALGSGDAVNRTRDYFSDFEGDILVLCGDTPLIEKETIEKIIREHRKKDASCTLLAARAADPTGYGRIERDDKGDVSRIIEDQDTTVFEEAIEEVNVGAYCFKKEDLFLGLGKIKINAAKKEYYLTDIIGALRKLNKKISSVSAEKPGEYTGINTRIELAEVNRIFRQNVLNKLMLEGVTIVDPLTTHIDMNAKIARDTTIYPSTTIEKDVVIGRRCNIGPFARIRSGTVIKDDVKIGNFTELVRTVVGSRTKINHMCYLGDASLGEDVNIGAGAITANYDGKTKNKTIIEDGAFIGVGATLVAPVKIGKKAIVGAGCVVTKNKDVPAGETVIGVPARVVERGSKK